MNEVANLYSVIDIQVCQECVVHKLNQLRVL